MTFRIEWIVAGLAAFVAAAPAFAQAPVAGPPGSSLFSTYCASCHGPSARGDAPLASVMRIRPADLTQIALRANGTFVPADVARIIDGRKPLKGLGGGEMPVWGDAFSRSADSVPADEKIKRLVAFLESMQRTTH
jgi:Cytochrome c553